MIIEPGRFCAALNCSGNTQLCFNIQHPQLSKMDRKEDLKRNAKATESIPLHKAFKTRSMSRKTRCILAYALAKSVWQYYGSEWMKSPWTRENIHLLDDQPVLQDLSQNSYFSRPYLATDLQENPEVVSEYIEGGMLWHRYPHVLALGILLIEVAKGKPFEVPNVPLDYSQDSINRYCKSAQVRLKKEGLFEKREDDFDSYREAVEVCLRFDHFLDPPSISGQQQPAERDRSLGERRDIIYRKVVRPLKELLRGTRWLPGIDEMRQDIDLESTNALSDTSARPTPGLDQPTNYQKIKENSSNANSVIRSFPAIDRNRSGSSMNSAGPSATDLQRRTKLLQAGGPK